MLPDGEERVGVYHRAARSLSSGAHSRDPLARNRLRGPVGVSRTIGTDASHPFETRPQEAAPQDEDSSNAPGPGSQQLNFPAPCSKKHPSNQTIPGSATK
jgi:hypothetical protein